MNKFERILADGMKKIKLNPHYTSRGKWVEGLIIDAEEHLKAVEYSNEYFQ